jgi:hypothetical protein
VPWETHPKEVIMNKKKAEDVFYDPKVATKELIDEVYESVNDQN